MEGKEEKYTHPIHNRLWLFRKPRSPFWYCGFHHRGKYIRISTKCRTKPEAEQRAADWYLDKQVEARTGELPRKITKPTVKDMSVLAINKLRSQVERQVRSPEYLKGFLKYMNVHVLPNFGHLAVDLHRERFVGNG